MNSPPSPKFSTNETMLLLLLRQATTTPLGDIKRGYRRRSAAGSIIGCTFNPHPTSIENRPPVRLGPVFARQPCNWPLVQPPRLLSTCPRNHQTRSNPRRGGGGTPTTATVTVEHE